MAESTESRANKNRQAFSCGHCRQKVLKLQLSAQSQSPGAQCTDYNKQYVIDYFDVNFYEVFFFFFLNYSCLPLNWSYIFVFDLFQMFADKSDVGVS